MFVQRVPDYFPTASTRTFSGLPLTSTEIVGKVARKCLKELAISMTISAFVVIFVPVSIGTVTILSAVILQFVVSLFFHSLGAFAACRAAKAGPAVLNQVVAACEWWTGENFAFFTGVNAQMLVHEMGHAIATLSLYKNPRPRVELMPFEGGLTTYYKALGALGKKIGPVATTIAVTASGPAFTLLVSAIILAVGLAIRAKHPHISKYFISWGVLDFLNHARYAYSTINADPFNLAHDFAHLSILGINPVVATIAILAIPIVITIGMQWWQSRQPKERPLPIIEPVISWV